MKFQQDKFINDICEYTQEILLYETLNAAANLTEQNHSEDEEKERGRREAKQILKHPRVKEVLKPVISCAGKEMTEIAKIVATALTPLAFGPQAVVQPSVIVFAWVAYLIFKYGAKAFSVDSNSNV